MVKMKYYRIVISIVLICIVLSACSLFNDRRTEFLGCDISEFKIIEEKDTHGGFFGDGSYYLTLDCSENAEKARDIIKDWKALPLSEILEVTMYGGKIGDTEYMFNFAEEAHLPNVSNGVYKFVDRHSEATNESDESDLLNRGDLNFSIAIYDFDTNILYYFEEDT